MSKKFQDWFDVTWSPTTGCSAVSAGCLSCPSCKTGKKTPKRFTITERRKAIDQPKKWARPRLIRVNPDSDLFHDQIDPHFILQVLKTVAECEQHIFVVLTKRVERIGNLCFRNPRTPLEPIPIRFPKNLWLGVIVEGNKDLDRVERLRNVRGVAKRVVSFTPLLERIEDVEDAIRGIDWVIAGGETGRNPRPLPIEWIDEISNACIKANVPFFFRGMDILTDGSQPRNIPDSIVNEPFLTQLRIEVKRNERDF